MNMRIFISFFCLALTTNCARQPTRDDIAGHYVFNTQYSFTDSIFVFQDSTYIHKYTFEDDSSFVSQGNWDFDEKNSEVMFTEFFYFGSNFNRLSSGHGYWSSRVYIVDEQVRFNYAEEDNKYYWKIR
jgi:hypothetical protein